MRVLEVILVCVLAACGGKTAGGGPSGGSSGAGSAGGGASGGGSSNGSASGGPVDAGPCAGGQQTCVEVDPSTYDRSCNVDSDCVEVTTGTICPGQCACGFGSVINVSEMARYDEAVSQIAFADCPCPSDGTPRCVQSLPRPSATGSRSDLAVKQ